MSHVSDASAAATGLTMTVSASDAGGPVPQYSLPACFQGQHTEMAWLPSGLHVNVQDCRFEAPVHATFHYDDNPFFFFDFFLQGSTSDWSHAHGSPPEMRFCGPLSQMYAFRGAGTCRFDAHTPLQYVCIGVSQDDLHRMLGDAMGILPKACQRDMRALQDEGFGCNAAFTGAMRMRVHQLLRMQQAGPHASLLLESKAMELLVAFVEAVGSQQHKASSSATAYILPDEREKLHAAQDILRNEYADPPSIAVLSRRIGLNECKLKRSFKAYFNTTVYGYVQQERMRQAKRFLDDGLSVTIVSDLVGYVNKSHFAVAYRKYHGIAPGDSRRK